jgi:hypothetical protein
MLSIIKRILSAAIVIAAVAAPTAASARLDLDPISAPAPAQPLPAQAAPTAAPHAVNGSSSQSFEWGDAGIGAGGLLVLIAVGTGAAVVYRRRGHRPLAG